MKAVCARNRPKASRCRGKSPVTDAEKAVAKSNANGAEKRRFAAERAFLERAARCRMRRVWDQPKPGGWFSRLLGKITKGK